MNEFIVTDFDREIWKSELADFVPDKIFDAHAHLWNDQFATPATAVSALRFNTDLAVMQKFTGQLFPGRETHFLLLGTPMKDIDFTGDRHWQYVTHPKNSNLWEFGTGPSSDMHAEGWPAKDVRPEHLFLRVKGGFLKGTTESSDKGETTLKLQHCDVDGNIVHEEIFKSPDPSQPGKQ